MLRNENMPSLFPNSLHTTFNLRNQSEQAEARQSMRTNASIVKLIGNQTLHDFWYALYYYWSENDSIGISSKRNHWFPLILSYRMLYSIFPFSHFPFSISIVNVAKILEYESIPLITEMKNIAEICGNFHLNRNDMFCECEKHRNGTNTGSKTPNEAQCLLWY